MAVSAPVRADPRAVALGTPFARVLGAFLRAYQLQAAVLWSLRALAAGLAADVLVLAAQRLTARFDFPLLALAAPPLVGAALGAALGATRRPSLGWLAGQVDQRLGLHERTVTALELLGRGSAARSTSGLGLAQIEDSIAYLRRAEPLEAFPLLVPRRELVAAGVLALALVPLVLMNPLALNDRKDPRLDQVVRGEAERVSATADEIADEPTDDPNAINPQAAAILRQVADQLRQAEGNPDQAMAQLGDAERRLSSLQRPGVLDTASAMSRLADALDQQAQTRAVASALDQGNYQQAAQEMRDLGARAAQGSDADRQAIAQALQQGASAAGRYDDALANALREAADRASRGESGSTDRAAQEMARAGNALSRQETLERAMSQLQNSRQAIGNGTAPQNGQGQGQQGGQAQNQAQQGQPGSGQGDQGGQGQGQGQGQNGDQGDGQSGGAGTGTQARTTDLYNPAAVRSRQVQVPGGDFDRPQIAEGSPTDAPDGEARVDYRDVLPTYQQRATKAMQDRYIPLGMKDLVRDYFSSLGQNGGGGR